MQLGKPIDFSVMPSFRCNLTCWFCMYNCGPEVIQELDYSKTKTFLASVDWSMINAFGFYGGEPSISIPLYDQFIALVPKEINKFLITNGSWSTCLETTKVFLMWCAKHSFQVIVSSTPEHVKFQDRNFLKLLEKTFAGAIELKAPDEIHAQGRAKGKPGIIKDCRGSCLRTDRNIRLGLKPDGNIVFQNCHGEYHVVQTYNEPFTGILDRTVGIRDACLRKERPCGTAWFSGGFGF